MKKQLTFLPAIFMLAVLAVPFSPAHAQTIIQGTGTASLIEQAIRNASSDQKITAADIPEVKSFYELRRFEPAWRLGDASTRNTVQDFITYIRNMLYDHGLNEKNYSFGLFESKLAANTPESLAEADMVATSIVMRLAQSLGGNSAVPSSKLHSWPIRRAKIDMPVELNKAVNDRKVAEFLQSLIPDGPKYRRMQEALTHYRDVANKGNWKQLPTGPTLRPGETSSRVPQLHKNLADEGYTAFAPEQYASNVYDAELERAVKAFQETHGLNADGSVGAETIKALNISPQQRVDQIRVNMARIRHSPPDAWSDIVINIPAARLSFFRQGKQVYEAPVVVGRVDRPTPLISSAIYEMVINPPWYVPRSIAERDILPKLRKNPDYLEKMGISVRGGEDGEGDIAGRLRQKPGPGNSLGRLKFNFANPHAVYLHGTPHTELFERDNRSQSSGCIRLEKPDDMAMIFLRDDPEWDEKRLQKTIDSVKTVVVKAPEKTPVKLLYWTVDVDDKNNVNFYNDIYNLDKEWLKYL